MKKKEKITVAIQIDYDLHEKLKEITKNMGNMSMAALFRLMANQYLSEVKDSLKGK